MQRVLFQRATTSSSFASLGRPAARPALAARRHLCSASRILRSIYFADTHEWIKVSDDKMSATMGVSDFAQKELGSIVYVDMPDPPHEVEASDSVAAIECGDGKAVGEVYTPQDCEITEINESLTSDPSIINKDPYGDGWIVKVNFKAEFAQGKLMEKEAYEKYLETCEKHH